MATGIAWRFKVTASRFAAMSHPCYFLTK